MFNRNANDITTWSEKHDLKWVAVHEAGHAVARLRLFPDLACPLKSGPP